MNHITPKSLPVLDKGHVKLLTGMGSDALIAHAARSSYGNFDEYAINNEATPKDISLIRRLMKDYHTSPFEMVKFMFHINVPIDIWRQFVRHRTANINEYSTRYKPAIEDYRESHGIWRKQSQTNKQCSDGLIESWDDLPQDLVIKTSDDDGKPIDITIKEIREDYNSPKEFLNELEHITQSASKIIYSSMLQFGVAREQARKHLTLSNYTEAIWCWDLHNLFHFINLRIREDAQEEAQDYAKAMLNLIEPYVPHAVEAFKEYRLHATSLSRTDSIKLIELLKTVNAESVTNITDQLQKSLNLNVEYKEPTKRGYTEASRRFFERNPSLNPTEY